MVTPIVLFFVVKGMLLDFWFYLIFLVIVAAISSWIIKISDNNWRDNLLIGIVFLSVTVFVGKPIWRLCNPPPRETMSKFFAHQVSQGLSRYLMEIGNIYGYSFDNRGFQALPLVDTPLIVKDTKHHFILIPPLQTRTDKLFLVRNTSGVRELLIKKGNTEHSRDEWMKMHESYKNLYNAVDDFISRYGEKLNDSFLDSLYNVKELCSVGIISTEFLLKIYEKDPSSDLVVNDSYKLKNPDNEILGLIEKLAKQINSGKMLREDPLTF